MIHIFLKTSSPRHYFLFMIRGVVRGSISDFGRSFNPISTRGAGGGADYAHQIILALPDFPTFQRPCVSNLHNITFIRAYLPYVKFNWKLHTKKFVFNLLTSKVSASIKINYLSLRLYSNLVPKGFNVYQDTYKNEPWGEIFHWIFTITSWFLGYRVMQAASKDTICCHCFSHLSFECNC